jgi:hypothetical protein
MKKEEEGEKRKKKKMMRTKGKTSKRPPGYREMPLV